MTNLFYDSTSITDNYDRFAIIDTGTPYLGLPDDDVYTSFITMIQNTTNDWLDCTTTNFCFSAHQECSTIAPHLQYLVIVIDDVDYELSPE
jgi:hypothetical protein